MVKVKICGITNLEDALASVGAGCDALGFVFYKRSPRYITSNRAKRIILNLPKRIIKIGVFVNEQENTVRGISRFCHLDMLQFHGDESAQYCDKFKDCQVIKAVRIKNKIDLKHTLKYNTFAYLFDAFVKSKIGGTGKSFDWGLIRQIRQYLKCTVFLSGGLDKKNVREAMEITGSDWVDVCSSVEREPGKKDHKKVKEFINVVKKSNL